VVRAGAVGPRRRFQVSVEEEPAVGCEGGDQGMASSKVVTILLVEDDEIDVKALKWAFDKLKIANPLKIARDGVEAWELLQELPRPYLIITDINMPRMNGIELLRKIRESEHCRDSIVFVLTTSNDEQDKIDAYDLNVAGYMLKSDMGTSFTRAISLIDNYWKVVEFPGPD
jgi:CheY-like chemotaxis protein